MGQAYSNTHEFAITLSPEGIVTDARSVMSTQLAVSAHAVGEEEHSSHWTAAPHNVAAE